MVEKWVLSVISSLGLYYHFALFIHTAVNYYGLLRFITVSYNLLTTFHARMLLIRNFCNSHSWQLFAFIYLQYCVRIYFFLIIWFCFFICGAIVVSFVCLFIFLFNAKLKLLKQIHCVIRYDFLCAFQFMLLLHYKYTVQQFPSNEPKYDEKYLIMNNMFFDCTAMFVAFMLSLLLLLFVLFFPAHSGFVYILHACSIDDGQNCIPYFNEVWQ